MPEEITEPKKEKDNWDKAEIIAKLVGAVLIPFVVLLVTSQINSALKQRDANLKLIELAISILKDKEPGSESNNQLRTWAVRVLGEHSDIPLPKVFDEVALLKSQIKQQSAEAWAGYAHAELISNPPGASVYLEPIQFPEIHIPVPQKTPCEINLLASEYKVVFNYQGKQQTTTAAIYYNRNNKVSVNFE